MAVEFREARETVPIEAVPLSHLSIEVGHVKREDLQGADDRLRFHFEQAAPWIQTALRTHRAEHGDRSRISTCFLVDDYDPSDSGRGPAGSPFDVVSLLSETARAQGFQLDYIVRESGCVLSADSPWPQDSDLVALAEIVAGRIVAEPIAGEADGSRPPTSETGWLCNGRRSPDPAIAEAMTVRSWEKPEEYGQDKHSIFLDAELWSVPDAGEAGQSAGQRSWSGAFLTAVWQLLRLGLIRDEGRAVARPYRWTDGDEWPGDWSQMPTVIQVSPNAPPFAAYRALSVLPKSCLPTEHAVQVILNHLHLDAAVSGRILERAGHEGISLPLLPSDRLEHVFVSSHVARDTP